MIILSLLFAAAGAVSGHENERCPTEFTRAMETWTAVEGSYLFWHGEREWSLPRAGVPYPLDLYCVADEEGDVVEIVGVVSLHPGTPRDCGDLCTRWILEAMMAAGPDRSISVGGPHGLRFMTSFCNDPPGRPITESECQVGAPRKRRLGEIAGAAKRTAKDVLLIPKDYRPRFMPPGEEKDRILKVVTESIKAEIEKMGWSGLYEGGRVDVLLGDFEPNQEDFRALYWHPNWGKLLRHIHLHAGTMTAHFGREATSGYSPNSGEMTAEEDMEDSVLRRFHENSIPIRIDLRKPPDK